MSFPPPPPARPLVLGIETSCDDTACAVLDGAGRVLSSVVSSQLEAHRPYGGVVPELASREHLRNWPVVSEAAFREAGCAPRDVDAVAATYGPGLVGSLLVGLSLGRAMAWALARPFFAVHHLEGHLYSPFLRPGGEPADELPEELVGLVVSGGHTSLVAVGKGGVRSLGETRDDAMGEAFDKVAKRLGLPFPGGPHLDAWAERAEAEGNVEPPSRLAVARCGSALDFSYSGLKTQTLEAIERLAAAGVETTLSSCVAGSTADARLLALVAEFRRAAVAQLLDRLERLRRRRPFRVLAVSGGVAANRRLRRDLEAWAAAHRIDLRLVDPIYAGDNAAMIAHAAWRRLRRGEVDDPRAIEASSRLPLGARDPAFAPTGSRVRGRGAAAGGEPVRSRPR